MKQVLPGSLPPSQVESDTGRMNVGQGNWGGGGLEGR